ncbi:hypothetical protein DXV76_10070 [Rhodobacteraceae bacterium CCMM004]|nr:hypothetical protein DXV76_10070 [Rhodobacteraceae bacterium CCMM004]
MSPRLQAAAAVLCACVALSAAAQDEPPEAADEAAAQGIGGIGLEACRNITGVQNLPVLAQVSDWALGYMAGRADGGAVPDPDEPLSPTSSTDLATAILTHCTGNPDATVLAAVRRVAARVYGGGPEDGAYEVAPPFGPARTVRPPQRPEGLTGPAAGEDGAAEEDIADAAATPDAVAEIAKAAVAEPEEDTDLGADAD